MIEHETHQFTPLEAVQNSMRHAISVQIMNYFIEDGVDLSNEVESDIKTATKKKCYISSSEALVHTYTHYPKIFDTYLLLASSQVALYPGWDHAVFLTHAHKGDWFIGSPGNIPLDPTSLFPIQEPTLTKALLHLKDTYPGVWPRQHIIEETIHNDPGGMVPIFRWKASSFEADVYELPLIAFTGRSDYIKKFTHYHTTSIHPSIDVT